MSAANKNNANSIFHCRPDAIYTNILKRNFHDRFIFTIRMLILGSVSDSLFKITPDNCFYLQIEFFECMKIKLLQIGKTTEAYLLEGISHYEKRINGFIPQSIETIPSLKDTNTASPENMKLREGELILARLKPDDVVVLLDENGKTFNSVGFANFLEKQFNQSIRNLVFIIGGAYGFSDAVYKRANFKIALSEMTFSHQLVRLVFMEQLYRGMTIIHKHPYDHQ